MEDCCWHLPPVTELPPGNAERERYHQHIIRTGEWEILGVTGCRADFYQWEYPDVYLLFINDADAILSASELTLAEQQVSCGESASLFEALRSPQVQRR